MTRRSFRAAIAVPALALGANLLSARFALAHPAPFGLTGYPVLVLHPFIVLDHALCLIAAGLLAGQQGLGLARTLASLAAGIVTGFACLVLLPGFPGEHLLPLIFAGLAGLLVAAAPGLNRWAASAAVAAAGFTVGLNTWPEDGLLYILLATLGGLLLGAGLLVGLAALAAARLKRNWQRIGVRVAGSWVAAVAIMILALAYMAGPARAHSGQIEPF